MIQVSPELEAALNASWNQPLDLYELRLDSGIRYYSNIDITWNGNRYLPYVLSRAGIKRFEGGEFDRASITFSNADTAIAQMLATNEIEGRRLIIRKIDQTVTNDSIVLFNGLMDRTGSITAEAATIQARQLLGSIDHDAPARTFTAYCPWNFKGFECGYAGAETQCNKSWSRCSELSNTARYGGFRFMPHTGAFQYKDVEQKRFLLFFKRKSTKVVTQAFSSSDDTPYDVPIPIVLGRAQMTAIPIQHVDAGAELKVLAAFCAGAIKDITYIRANEQLVTDFNVHRGELGGTGNQTTDPRFPTAYPYNLLAYAGLTVPSDVKAEDAAPGVTGVVRGALVDQYNTSGGFVQVDWSDNPVWNTRHFLRLSLAQGGMGFPEEWIDEAVCAQTAAYCDELITNPTNDQKIFEPQNLPNGIVVGQEYRRYQSTGVDGQLETNDGPYSTYTPGTDDDTDTTPVTVQTKRFTLNCAIAKSAKAVDILYKVLLPSFRGYLTWSKEGKVQIRSERPVAAVSMAFTDANTIGTIEYPLADRQTSVNRISIKYVDAPSGFEQRDLQINDYAHQDSVHKVNKEDMDGSAIDSYFQAWRIGQWKLAKARDLGKFIQFRADIKATRLEIGDKITVSSTEHGLVNVEFRVIELGFEENDEVSILAQIYSAGLYNDQAPQTTLVVPTIFNPILPTTGGSNAPGLILNPALLSTDLDTDPGSVMWRVQYDPPVGPSANQFSGVHWYLRNEGADPEWIDVGTTPYPIGETTTAQEWLRMARPRLYTWTQLSLWGVSYSPSVENERIVDPGSGQTQTPNIALPDLAAYIASDTDIPAPNFASITGTVEYDVPGKWRVVGSATFPTNGREAIGSFVLRIPGPWTGSPPKPAAWTAFSGELVPPSSGNWPFETDWFERPVDADEIFRVDAPVRSKGGALTDNPASTGDLTVLKIDATGTDMNVTGPDAGGTLPRLTRIGPFYSEADGIEETRVLVEWGNPSNQDARDVSIRVRNPDDPNDKWRETHLEVIGEWGPWGGARELPIGPWNTYTETTQVGFFTTNQAGVTLAPVVVAIAITAGDGGLNLGRAATTSIDLANFVISGGKLDIKVGGITDAEIATVAAGKITGAIVAGQIGSVNATAISGLIAAGQINSITAGQVTGQLTAGQIGAVNAGSIVGQLSAGQIGAVNAGSIVGFIQASQIAAVSASSVTGVLAASQIGAVNAGSITGTIVAGQIGSVNAGAITGVIVTAQLADQILNTQRLLASDLGLIRRVTALPGLPNSNYPAGATVLRTSDRKLFKSSGSAWSAVNPSDDITGTLTSTDIVSVSAAAITGLIIATQIQNINANQINGTIQANQIGTIQGSQIANIAANTITIGTIQDSQIGAISASKIIAGTISASILMTSPALQITGAGFQVQMDSQVGVRVTNTFNSSKAEMTNGEFFVQDTADTRYAAVLASGLFLAQSPVGAIGFDAGYFGTKINVVASDNNQGMQITPNGILGVRAGAVIDMSGSNMAVRANVLSAQFYRSGQVITETINGNDVVFTKWVPWYDSNGNYIGKMRLD
jgi:hypothetical protein